MSRLYDALKGAGGLRTGAHEKEEEGVWEALGIQGTDGSPIPSDPDVIEAGVPARGLTDDLAAVPQTEHADDALSTETGGMLGTVRKATLDKRARVIPHALDPVVAEQYRQLRTKIVQQQEERPFRSLLVTSAGPQEGKTLTVLNLGLSFAMLPSFKVLVVDGDMRRGTLGLWMGVDESCKGLSNLIDGSAQIEDVLMRSDEIPMHFITRGNSHVADLYTSQLASHFQRLSEQFDLVLVDTPPVNLIADVQLLAASCDAVLLVARAFSTSRKAFEKAVEELRPFRVIGTVLNAGTADKNRYRGYY